MNQYRDLLRDINSFNTPQTGRWRQKGCQKKQLNALQHVFNPVTEADIQMRFIPAFPAVGSGYLLGWAALKKRQTIHWILFFILAATLAANRKPPGVSTIHLFEPLPNLLCLLDHRLHSRISMWARRLFHNVAELANADYFAINCGKLEW